MPATTQRKSIFAFWCSGRWVYGEVVAFARKYAHRYGPSAFLEFPGLLVSLMD